VVSYIIKWHILEDMECRQNYGFIGSSQTI
jgi:hypothetical protein